MTKKSGLPKTLYVKLQEKGTKDEFLWASEKESELATTETELVGVYELKRVNKVKLEVVSKPA